VGPTSPAAVRCGPWQHPEFVPLVPGRTEKAYESPPWRADGWLAERPGDLVDEGRQPQGGDLGFQGPDQGYALKLANGQRDKLQLAAGEHADDAITGCVAVALRRASLYGRAPVMHDVRLAFELFGFLDEDADAELVAWRTPVFGSSRTRTTTPRSGGSSRRCPSRRCA
jgi:hypothetical protein